MKEEYKTASEEAELPELNVSDGSMRHQERTDFGIERWYELETTDENGGMLMVRRPADDSGGFEYYLQYQRDKIEDSVGSGESEDGRSVDFRDRGSYTEHIISATDLQLS